MTITGTTSESRSPSSDPLEPTIFHERWWLDTATEGRCQFVEVEDGGRIVARMPYVTRRRFGLILAEMPRFTHFLGPAIDDGKGKSNTRLLRRLDITNELIEKLPKLALFYTKCHKGINDVVPFMAHSFRVAVQFTHEIPAQPEDVVWQAMRDKGRNGIRLARENVTIDTAVAADEFVACYSENLAAQNTRNWMEEAIWRKLIATCMERKRGTIFGARNPSGKLTSAIFCIWDGNSYYYFNSTRQPDAHRGVISLLLWEAIRDAMARGLTFDFDGAPNEGSFRLATNFTSIVSPRYIVIRESGPMRVYRTAKSLVKPPFYFE